MNLQLVLNNKLSEIDKIYSFVDTVTNDLNLLDKQIMQIKLALEELFANIIMYAYKGGNGVVILSAESNPQVLQFTIIDNGIYFDITKYKDFDINLPLEERNVGGLGILMVRTIMNEIRYERKDNQNKITLLKYLK